MFYLIPRRLHRLALRTGHAARLVWWRWRKPVLDGCRVLAFDSAGRILLVRHTYGSGRWMLPGGGLVRGEDPVAAARRECLEETGCALAEPRLLTVISEPLAGATNRVHLVNGRIAGEPSADGREIAEAALFAVDALPSPRSIQLERELARWIALAEAL